MPRTPLTPRGGVVGPQAEITPGVSQGAAVNVEEENELKAFEERFFILVAMQPNSFQYF